MTSNRELKRHYYSISLEYSDGAVSKKATAYIGYPEQMVTIKRIAAAKRTTNMPPNSTVIAVCYLGFMTDEEMDNLD